MKKTAFFVEKIKIVSLLILFHTVCFSFGYAQNNDTLLYTKELANRSEKAAEVLQKCDAYNYVEFVEFNIDRILYNDNFVLQFDGKSINVSKVRLDIRDINSFVFVGKSNNGDFMLISVLGDDIQGVIETDGSVYSIETVGEREYALIQVDYSKLQENCNALPSNDNTTIENDIDYSNETNAPTEEEVPYVCKIRVLVLYTPSAESSVSNIKNTILTAVELTNESFTNSQINYQVELVYAGLTNYSENIDIQMDLSRFKNKYDGYMEEVHWLRNKYSADICVLLVNTSVKCGISYEIGALESSSFCVVSTYGTCATSNYSFAHEIGHLLGCRHDPDKDDLTFPFAYGHGYVNPAKTWRTIMAYSSSCNGCPRLLYWSNPNIVYEGVAMGTTSTSHNARVWNERANTIMTFRQPENDIVVSNSYMTNYRYGDIIAKQTIGTTGTVNVNSGNSLYLSAGTEILLSNGFWIQEGSDVSAKISNICDCGTTLSEKEKVMVQNISDPFPDTDLLSSVFEYTVYPNPSKETLSISYLLHDDSTIAIDMVNVYGKKVKTVQPTMQQQAGSYTYQLNLLELPSGTYFLLFSLNHTIKTHKIVITK